MPDAVSLLICDDHKVLTDALSMVVGVVMIFGLLGSVNRS